MTESELPESGDDFELDPVEDNLDQGKTNITPEEADVTTTGDRTVIGDSGDSDIELVVQEGFEIIDVKATTSRSVAEIRDSLHKIGLTQLPEVRTTKTWNTPDFPEEKGPEFYAAIIKEILESDVMPDYLERFAYEDSPTSLKTLFNGDSLKGLPLREMGQGGFASVLLVHELSTGKDHVVKMLKKTPSNMDTGNINQRFTTEKIILGAMDGYGFPRVTTEGAVVVEGQSRHYYAMEYKDSAVTVKNLIDKHGALPLQTTVNIMLLSTLYTTEMSSRMTHKDKDGKFIGAAHRDIKPDNMLLDPNREFNLLDPGIVKTSFYRDNATVEGAGVGTPATMAPEYASGLPSVYDGRVEEFQEHKRLYIEAADTYSIAATGYWMATGRPMFTGKTLVEILQQHLNGSVPDMSPFQKNARGIEFERIIRLSLERDIQKRQENREEILLRLFRLSSYYEEYNGDLQAFIKARVTHLPLPDMRQPEKHPKERGYRPGLSTKDYYVSMLAEEERVQGLTKVSFEEDLVLPQVPTSSEDEMGVETDQEFLSKTVITEPTTEQEPAVTRRKFLKLGVGAAAAVGVGTVAAIFATKERKADRVHEIDEKGIEHIRIDDYEILLQQNLEEGERILGIQIHGEGASKHLPMIDYRHTQSTVFSGQNASAFLREGIKPHEFEALTKQLSLSGIDVSDQQDLTVLHAGDIVCMYTPNQFYCVFNLATGTHTVFTTKEEFLQSLEGNHAIADVLSNIPTAKNPGAFTNVYIRGNNNISVDDQQLTKLKPFIAGGDLYTLGERLNHLK